MPARHGAPMTQRTSTSSTPRRRHLTAIALATAVVLLAPACTDSNPSGIAGRESGDEPPQAAAPAPPVASPAPAPALPPTSASPPRLPPLPPELRDATRLAARGQIPIAMQMAERFAATHPDDGLAAFVLGVVEREGDNHGRAVPHFQRALALLPDYYLARLYLGDSLYHLGELAGARDAYVGYAAVRPDDPVAHYSLGLVDLEEARLDAAEARFRKALALFDRMRTENPRLYAAQPATRARCHARLADVHFARDEYEAARDELLVATDIAPGIISAFHALSQVYRRLGDDARADEALARYERERRAMLDRSRGSGG